MRDAVPDLVSFAGLLRAAGVGVGTGQVEAFVEAAAGFAPVDLVDLYWVGRTCLVSRPDDISTYDQVFRAFWLDHAGDAELELSLPGADGAVVRDTGSDLRGRRSEGADGHELAGSRSSERERLRHRRFDRLTDEELAQVRGMMARIALAVPHRKTRRTEPVPRGTQPDLRRSFSSLLATDGELIRRAWRGRRTRPRPLVLVLDVSGSMAGFSRALLQFAHAATVAVDDLEVFCFGTRLTRITAELDRRDPDAALAAAAERVVDWDGGTQIGVSLAALNRTWGRRGVLRGAVVVICSDGLERGDPELLGAEVSRLARFAHRLIWVNPLRGSDDYDPVQRGMRAALPHVDDFVSGHDLASLEDLATLLGART